MVMSRTFTKTMARMRHTYSAFPFILVSSLSTILMGNSVPRKREVYPEKKPENFHEKRRIFQGFAGDLRKREKPAKKMKKPVDKGRQVWYYSKAVERDGKN